MYCEQQIQDIRAKVARLQKIASCGEVRYSPIDLTGSAQCNYKIGVNYNNGNLFYKDQGGNWQPIVGSGGSGANIEGTIVQISAKIGGDPYVAVNTTSVINGLDDGSSAIQSDAFIDCIVQVFIGNIFIPPYNQGFGDNFFTKSLGSDTINLDSPINTGDDIVIYVFGPVSGTLGIQSIAAGLGITIDNSDPANPIISASGGAGWSLTGNAGTDETINFSGTTDNIPYHVRVNNNIIAKFGVDFNISMGNSTDASGPNSIAFGEQTSANDYAAFASGVGSSASGQVSTAAGYYTQAKAFNGFVVGQYNDATDTPNPASIAADDRIFQIGNGNLGTLTTSNAMTVLRNGNIGIGNIVPTATLELGTPDTIEATYLQSFTNSASAAAWYSNVIGQNILRISGDDNATFFNESNYQWRHIIGGTSGDYPLTIKQTGGTGGGYGTIQFGIQNSGDSEVGIQLDNLGTGGSSRSIFVTNSSSSLGADLFVIANASSTRPDIVINSIGNVGIQTVDPDKTLHINGSTKMDGAVYHKVNILPDVDYVVADDDYLISCKDWVLGNLITLPDPTTCLGRELIIFLGTVATPIINEKLLTFDGTLTSTFKPLFSTVKIISDGVVWMLISQDSVALP